MSRPVAATLVGRALERALLVEAANRADGGEPTIVLVQGEAGIGKTRLVSAWAQTMRDCGAVVAVGRCVEVEGAALPMAPIAGALRDLARQLGGQAIQDAAAGLWPVVAELVPDLAESTDSLRRVTHAETFDAIAALTRRLCAGRLLVLVVEDLHWSGTLTRDLLAFLARAMTNDRLLIVITTRLDVVDPVSKFLAELTRLPRTEAIELPRLSPLQVGEIAQQLTGGHVRAGPLERLVRLSDGVPFLVEELAASGLGEPGRSPSATISPSGQLLLRRFSQLSADARQVLAAASLADAELTDRLLRAALAGHVSGLDAALSESVDAGVLVLAPDRDGYRFRHALLRDAIMQSLLPGQVRALHERWALALEEAPRALDPLTRAVALAHHWDGVGRAERALCACLAAAEQCRLRSAFVEQADLLTRAVRWWDEVDDPEALTGLDRDLLAEDVVDVLLAADLQPMLLPFAEKELRRLPEIDRLGRARWRTLIADISTDFGLMVDLPDLPDLIQLARGSPPSRPRAWLAHHLMWLLGPGDADRAVEMMDLAATSAEALGDQALSLYMRVDRAYVLTWIGRPDQALDCNIALLPQIDQLSPASFSLLLSTMVGLNYQLGHLDAALAAVADTRRRLSDEHQAPLAWSRVSGYHAWTLFDLGRWDDALRVFDAARARYDDDDWRGVPLSIVLSALRGDLDEAERAAAEVGLPEALSDGRRWDHEALARVTLAAARGDIGVVRNLVASMLSRPDLRASAVAPRVLLVAAAAEADAAARGRARGDRAALDAGRSAVVVLRQVLARTYWPGPVADALQFNIAAELDRWLGSTDPAPWRIAIDAWTPIGFPHERGWAALHLAEALIENRDLDRAAAALGDSAAIAQRLDEQPLADEVAGLARRARLRLEPTGKVGEAAARTNSPTETHGLTDRELEVLALVCEGLTNPAIGKRLYMSRKTASVHISHILTKLGATNRTQAATAAHRLGLERDRSLL